jgi:uncharacterized lipoprotein YajG
MIKKLIAVAALSTMLAACSTQTFTLNNHDVTTPKTDAMQAFFVYGIGQTQTVNAAAICGGAKHVVKTEVQQTFVDGLLQGLTFGIFSPRQARVYCSK